MDSNYKCSYRQRYKYIEDFFGPDGGESAKAFILYPSVPDLLILRDMCGIKNLYPDFMTLFSSGGNPRATPNVIPWP